jgi:hypothetical protein
MDEVYSVAQGQSLVNLLPLTPHPLLLLLLLS